MMRHAVVFAMLVIGALFAFAAFDACTPAQRAAVPALTDDACVLIRFAHDPTADALCATAEDLAPFVPAMVAARAEADAGPAAGKPARTLVQVAELPAPRARSPAKRRCVSWVATATLVDGSDEAAALDDAAATRNDEAGRGARAR